MTVDPATAALAIRNYASDPGVVLHGSVTHITEGSLRPSVPTKYLASAPTTSPAVYATAIPQIAILKATVLPKEGCDWGWTWNHGIYGWRDFLNLWQLRVHGKIDRLHGFVYVLPRAPFKFHRAEFYALEGVGILATIPVSPAVLGFFRGVTFSEELPKQYRDR